MLQGEKMGKGNRLSTLLKKSEAPNSILFEEASCLSEIMKPIHVLMMHILFEQLNN